ncbi:MAG: polynucleotide kinase-phosphatase [Deltaproteobacteria bacterium]|jgi:protein phosphatase|nr:polynucleotide kinase-phosphatase [Deltaproteobacteria bacterium]
MRIEIPQLSVVALVGASGCGKSTFAGRHFLPTEVLSSDFFRGLISDDESDQKVTPQAFETLYYIANRRLDLGRLTVIDATNVQKDARAQVLKLARDQDCHAVAIVLDIPEKVCQARNAARSDRTVPASVVARHSDALRRSIRHLRKEGFRYVHVLKGQEEVDACEIVRAPLWNDKRELEGPFDVIGDVHGCYGELCALLAKLGYSVAPDAFDAVPPAGRTAVFLGDLCDRGPRNVAVLRLVMNMTRVGRALCVPGNHDVKLLRMLGGGAVKPTHGIDRTKAEFSAVDGEFAGEVEAFLRGLVSHYVLDGGRLVVSHAGLKEKYQGRGSPRVRNFCLYGETTGETDEFGLPVLLPWADEYRGGALVVYGHTPVLEPELVNNTICIDTGCVFGGKLTAFRYPERETVQVAAFSEHYPPVRPLKPPRVGSAAPDDLLRIEDVLGIRRISTRLRKVVKINAENSAAALEVMSRFAADPHWLIYLPPAMSPCETSQLPGFLEHPEEAFSYYASHGAEQCVCEEKHMGSRAVVVCSRDAGSAARRFGVGDGSSGIVHTRTGRHFFDDPADRDAILSRLRASLDASGFWERFSTDWVCLDCEIMPWSAKAQKLLEDRYAAVGRAGRTGLAAVGETIARAIETLSAAAPPDGASAPSLSPPPAPMLDLSGLLERFRAREDALESYVNAYRRYCWDVKGPEDYRIAPFHLLATEGRIWFSESHLWHMKTLGEFVAGRDPVFIATDHRMVDLKDRGSVSGAVKWWEDLTGSGGEGMVVKPLDFVPMKGSSLLQPAVKCRGREYLRIIYGPEYLLGNGMELLKKRSLSRKRGLALDEFALGIESLERFVRNEPLRSVHECVFGVLALESEPVDPRL